MFSVTNDMGFVPQSEKFEDREMIGENINNYKVIRQGDFAYNPARINVGSIARYQEDYPCMISSLYVCFKPDEQLVNSDLLLHILKSPRLIDKYKLHGEGGVRIYLFYPNFAQIRIWLPKTNREQIKMAKLLNLIEERIVTQNRIIEELKLFRSAIYQKVFSSMHGETVALCKIADIIKGKQINGTELYDTGDYYVMNGGTVPSGYYDDYNTPANTISISEGGNSCGYVQFNDVPFWSGGHCYTLSISSSQIVLRYLFHYLKYREQDIMALRIGSGLPNIQKKNLERFQILIPTFDGQHRYAKIFDSLQHKEVVETSLLNKWQTQKKYLLRQMFI